MLRMNLDRAETFVLAEVPFDQIPIHFGCGAEAGQFAGASGTLQGTRENLCKCHSGQSFPKPSGVAFATLSQRQIGQSGMLARQAPRGLAVAHEIYYRKGLAHVARSGDRGRILLQPREIFFSLAPRGTSGERDGERGIQWNGPPLPNPLLLLGRRGCRSPPAAWWL